MSARNFGLALVASVALLAGGAGQALAVSCTGQYNAANGGTTIATATSIGTVGAGCMIGPFSASGGSNGNAATVSNAANPSIYQFDWGGGVLSIQEELGNNGIGYDIFVELGLKSAATLNADSSLNPALASITIAYQSGPGAPVYVIQNLNLAAGTYVLDTYLGTCAHSPCTTDKSIDDPQYQVLFTPGAATPLPAALPMFVAGAGLIGGLAGYRKRRKDSRAG